jgi:transcriptional regulator with XRE-family HTH domain
MKNDYLHKISVKELSKDMGLTADEIAKLAGIKTARNLGKWAQSKPDGSRPNYNAFISLLQNGATVETLFGVNYAEIHNYVPKLPLEPDDSPMDYNDPKFIDALEKGLKIIEERKKKAGESQ